MTEQNLTRCIADYLDANGWEGGAIKGKQAGPRIRWIDEDHYVWVGLNNRHLTASAALTPSSHQISVGLTHVGILKLFGQLFGDQGPFGGFITARLDRFGAPEWINDQEFSGAYGQYVPFDDVIALIDGAHALLVQNHLGPAGIRAGVQEFNHPNTRLFYASTVDAFVGWSAHAATQLAELAEDPDYPRFIANLTEHLGFDPLNPAES